MMIRGEKGSTVFGPDILHIKAGDRVKFIATRKSHNAATIDRIVPEGHPGFEGKINGEIEAFNSKLRAECLNAHWFLTLANSREKLETWRRYYNEDRPHSAMGYNVPIAMHNRGGATSPSS